MTARALLFRARVAAAEMAASARRLAHGELGKPALLLVSFDPGQLRANELTMDRPLFDRQYGIVQPIVGCRVRLGFRRALGRTHGLRRGRCSVITIARCRRGR